MRIYFYHTQDIQRIVAENRRGLFPGHFLYGATRFEDHGIEVVWHRFSATPSRLRNMLATSFRVLRMYRKIDAVYATHYTGIEPLIFLRAAGLFRKPIILWHHQPVITPRSWFREHLGRIFYRGIDGLIFFSQKLIDESLKTGKIRPEQTHLGHWGADLDFYDRLMAARQEPRAGFISTGKEMRDMPTLVEAFRKTAAPLDIYIGRSNGNINYERIFQSLDTGEQVHVHFTHGLKPYELSLLVNRAACVAICCQETNYTVGLTTVVEAMALGLPILCSRNPQIPIDVDQEGCGISMPYGDTEAWEKAIRYILEHPAEAKEMGRKGRRLAEKTFNDSRCAAEVAEWIRSTIDSVARKK